MDHNAAFMDLMDTVEHSVQPVHAVPLSPAVRIVGTRHPIAIC